MTLSREDPHFAARWRKEFGAKLMLLCDEDSYRILIGDKWISVDLTELNEILSADIEVAIAKAREYLTVAA